MNTKKIAFYTALFALAAGILFTCYRGVQLYHEVTRSPVLVASEAPAVQPGKQVTTYTFSVIREVVVPPAPVIVPRRAPRRRK